MKEIPLTQGYFAKVDNDDFDFLSKFKWRVKRGENTCYAYGFKMIGKRKYKTLMMHRLLFPDSTELHVDHVDCNGLNNQRSNLRLCTPSQNKANQFKFPVPLSSKFKGVSWCKRDKRWVVRLKFCGKQMALGNFKDEVQAAKAYDVAAKEHFGEFAKLNFPGGHL